MKTTIFGLLLAILTVSVNAQSKSPLNQEQLTNNLTKANKKQRTGAILTVIGGAATIGGYFMMENGMFRKYPSTPGHITGDTYSTIWGAAGIALFVVGVPIICIGVPTLFIGSIQKNRAQKNLQISLVNFNTPSNYSSINGIGLSIRF